MTISQIVEDEIERRNTVDKSLNNSSFDTSFHSEDPTSLYKKGFDLYNQGKYQESIEHFDKVLKIAPDNESARYNRFLALEHLSREKQESTVQEKRSQKTNIPEDVYTLNRKGLALYNQGKYQEAIEWYDKALKVDPYFTVAQDNKNIALEFLIKEKTFRDPIKKYSFLKSWGGEGEGDGEFNGPVGISIDSSGNVYVTDSGNHRIQKFNSNGTFITKWGKHIDLEDLDTDPDFTGRFERLRNTFSRSFSYGKFNEPCLITIISEIYGHDYVYIVDSGNHRIQKFDSTGIFKTKWGSKGEGDGEFDKPVGITLDSSGNVYVTDSGNHRIQKFDSNGTFITKWGSEGTKNGKFNNPAGIDIDSKGYVYVADSGNHRIQKFDSNGNFITKWGSEGTKGGEFNTPAGISIDSKRNVYVADSENNQIQVFAPAT